MRHSSNLDKRAQASRPHMSSSLSGDSEPLESRGSAGSATSSSAHSAVSRQPSPAPFTVPSRAARVQTRTQKPEVSTANQSAPPDTETESTGSTRYSRAVSTTTHWQSGVRKSTQRKPIQHSSPTKRPPKTAAHA
ncbi:hypothetical protein GGI23_001891, partial [Coemansia sp. RSA 2559]